MKKYVCLCVLLVVMMMASVVSAAALKVVVLPVQEYKCWTRLSDDVAYNVNSRILKDVHVPLNGILERVETIHPEISVSTFYTQYNNLLGINKKARPNEALVLTAEELGADILVLPLAVSCHQEVYSGFEGETYLITDANMELYVYRADSKETECYKASRHYSGLLGSQQMLSAEIMNCTEKVLGKAKLRDVIREMSNETEADDR